MSTRQASLDGWPLIGDTPGGGRSRLLVLDGWLTRTLRRDRTDNTGRAGATGSAGLDEARRITATGQTRYRDPFVCALERRQMLALVGPLGAPLVVTDALGALHATVELDEADATPVHDTLLAWSFVLTATDPALRSITATTVPVPAGQTVIAASDGTAAADLLIEVTSPGTVILTAGGVTLSTAPLPTGAVIDTAALTVESSTGVDLSTAVPTSSQWPSLPKGGGPLDNAGTADLSISYFDTYS